VVKIQGKVVKQGKRNALHRFVLSKTDKDKIADWRQDFMRILQVFNVGAIGSVGHSYTNSAAPLQTELAVDTNLTVTDTNTMVAGMYRNMVTEREGASGKNNLVSPICYPSKTDCSPSPRLDPG
jgi:hypothetical protein